MAMKDIRIRLGENVFLFKFQLVATSILILNCNRCPLAMVPLIALTPMPFEQCEK
jgi:hypothetical protein